MTVGVRVECVEEGTSVFVVVSGKDVPEQERQRQGFGVEAVIDRDACAHEQQGGEDAKDQDHNEAYNGHYDHARVGQY